MVNDLHRDYNGGPARPPIMKQKELDDVTKVVSSFVGPVFEE